jgi:exportin-2 (importin alpha re-exporter)
VTVRIARPPAQITEGIVIPSVALRDDDEERFAGDHVEFLRRDLEAADSDTRRRAAADLLSVLAERFPAETTPVGLAYVETLLSAYAASRSSEARRADCALRLFAALAVRGRTAAAGVTAVGEGVDVAAFYSAHVRPELDAADVNERPIVKAAALRCVPDTALYAGRMK